MKRIYVTLRTQQAVYLRRMAEREDTSFSEAFRCVVDASAVLATDTPRPAKIARKHVVLESRHIAILDHLAVKWGLTRSETARRLVDSAQAAEIAA